MWRSATSTKPKLAAAAAWAGNRARAYADFRHLLDNQDIDAVLIATPDHWHAIPTVLACEAGKDVYVEKPLAHNIREGQAMVRACRKYERVVQTGMQQRSAAHFSQAQQIVQSGQLGKVHFIRIWNFRNIYPRGMGTQENSAVPQGLDWDFYLGPAPLVRVQSESVPLQFSLVLGLRRRNHYRLGDSST